MKLIRFTKEQLEANWKLAEETFTEAFKDVPCSCPNCPGRDKHKNNK